MNLLSNTETQKGSQTHRILRGLKQLKAVAESTDHITKCDKS
jgi:hypothetical protein